MYVFSSSKPHWKYLFDPTAYKSPNSDKNIEKFEPQDELTILIPDNSAIWIGCSTEINLEFVLHWLNPFQPKEYKLNFSKIFNIK